MPHHCQMDYYLPGIIRMHILVVLKDSVVVKRRTGAIHRPKKDIVKQNCRRRNFKGRRLFSSSPGSKENLNRLKVTPVIGKKLYNDIDFSLFR